MSYTFSRSVTIDHTKCGASDSTNWTMLFYGTYSYLATVANGGNVQNGSGYDIAFFSDSGLTSSLSWEMPIYTAASGLVEIWVKIPTLSHTADTVIYLAYGNASILTFQGGAAGAAYDANVQRVYHWGDGATLSLADSSTNAATGTNNSGCTAVAGKIGGALSTASSSNVTNTSTTGLTVSGSWTISAWLKSTMAGEGVLVKIGNSTGASQEYVLLAATHKAQVGDRGGGSGRAIGTSTTNNDGNWHYFVGTYDGTFRIYVDGTLETTQAAGGGGINTGGTWYGIQSDGTSPYTGAQDESRFISALRSTDWILSEYNSQNNPATFYTIGSPVSSGGLFRNSGSLSGLGGVGKMAINPNLEGA